MHHVDPIIIRPPVAIRGLPPTHDSHVAPRSHTRRPKSNRTHLLYSFVAGPYPQSRHQSAAHVKRSAQYVGTHCIASRAATRRNVTNKAVIPSSHFDSCTPSRLLSPSTHPHLNISSAPPGTKSGRRGRLTTIARGFGIALTLRGPRGEVRQRLCGGVGQGHEQRSLRSGLMGLKVALSATVFGKCVAEHGLHGCDAG